MYGFYYHVSSLRFNDSRTSMFFSAAWSAFHLKRVIIMFVSSEVLNCRVLKLLLDYPMNGASAPRCDALWHTCSEVAWLCALFQGSHFSMFIYLAPNLLVPFLSSLLKRRVIVSDAVLTTLWVYIYIYRERYVYMYTYMLYIYIYTNTYIYIYAYIYIL